MGIDERTLGRTEPTHTPEPKKDTETIVKDKSSLREAALATTPGTQVTYLIEEGQIVDTIGGELDQFIEELEKTRQPIDGQKVAYDARIGRGGKQVNISCYLSRS